jgi:translocating chain-associated membrane protein 1
MAIKPGVGRKSSKNPPILSHEFVIQNHADIVSCIAMIFVIGLMVQATSSYASVFVALHHSITGADPTHENPRGIPYTYESGWCDWCAVFFYTLICIIMHAVLQEYVIDKISKRLHLSKFKLSRFNDSSQLIFFYAMSFLWGFDVILREGYISKAFLLWENYPEHPMIFLHKLFFIIQLAYYLHMLPELYFQKVKREDQQPKIIQSIVSFSFVALAYYLNFHRIALVLLTLHYLSEVISHVFVLIDIFDRDDKFVKLNIINRITFVFTRFATMVISVLTFYYKIDNSPLSLVALLAVFVLQGYLVFEFINNVLKARRASLVEQGQPKKKLNVKVEKSKKERKRESDLPEADQDTGRKPETKKVK